MVDGSQEYEDSKIMSSEKFPWSFENRQMIFVSNQFRWIRDDSDVLSTSVLYGDRRPEFTLMIIMI
jgi:hypothetical protein